MPTVDSSLRVLVAIALVLPAGAAFAQATGHAAPSFAHAAATGEAMPRLHSLLVSSRGRLVFERYFHDTDPDDVANVKSVSKSIVSALVGIAIDRGYIAGVDERIAAYFPGLLGDGAEPGKRTITIENLLTMQAGLRTTSNRYYGAWVLSPDWIEFALAQPLEEAPGGRMRYSTGNTHLLSAILTRTTGESTLEFARETLGRPLGFQLASWPTDPQGIYFGGNDMELTPRQMLAFGELYLNGGRIGARQVVPAAWVRASLEPRAESPREMGRYYGYGWWIRTTAGFETPYAWGYGGQFIFLVPAIEAVVVATSASTPGGDRRAHTRRLYDLIEHDVIAALGAAAPD